MLFASLFALATLSPPPAPQPSAAPGSVAAEVSHGRLDWFEGSFDELLAQAAREDKLVFLDFWADWCGWCKRLDTDVFSNGAVVREMADLLCLAVDKETEAGGALAQRYGVAPLPTVMFLDAEGQVLDAIVGYVPADEFLQRAQNVKRGIGTLPALRKAVADSPDDLFKRFDLAIRLRQVGAPDAARELARVRQMVNQGIGYDRKSIDDHWRLARSWEKLEDRGGFARHLEQIRKLDPERRSYPMRLRKLQGLQRQIRQAYASTGVMDLAPLDAFLAEEQYEQLKFDAWRLAIYMHGFEAEEARKRGRAEDQRRHESDVRRAEAEAWKVCPPDTVAQFGHDLAWGWYVRSDDLNDDELDFALSVAEAAQAAAPESATHLDTLACWLDLLGQVERAIECLERAIELEPDEMRYQRRLLEIRAED